MLSLALIPLNTDAFIPVMRGFFRGSALVTVIGVSVLANSKVLLAFWGFGKSSVDKKVPEVKHRFLARVNGFIRDWTVLTVAVLTLIPLPGLRSFCTAWCSATQSWRGLTALLVANPIHIWSLVLGWDWVLSLF